MLSRFARSSFACLILASLVAMSACGRAAPAPPADEAPPHIVILLADDLGWRDVGYHGSEIQTPHIDALAAHGRRLERFYVQPVCSPTRASLMTGRYPIRYGLQAGVIWPWADYGLPLGERTLPAALREAGYQTAIVGKWDLGLASRAYLPLQRGFDTQYGLYTGAIDYFSHTRLGGLDWHRNGVPVREEGYATTLLGREAARIIREHDPARPLFLYVPFNAPHEPLQVPRRYLADYEEIADDDRRTYAAMVTCMDEAIGRIVGALERRGMRSRTLIVFASDNGGDERWGADNGPLRGGKGSLYEGGVRVPAVVSWPGHVPSESTSDALVHVVDLYPTILRLAGASVDQPLPLDGRDMWGAIAGDAPGRDEVLINVRPLRGALRRGRWKLVELQAGATRRGPGEQLALFDLEADPSEASNVAASNPDQVQSLMQRLDVLREEAVAPRGTGVPSRMPDDFQVPEVWGDGS